MKRCFLFLAVVILASVSARQAQAQMGGFGSINDMSAEIETQRNQAKAQMKQYTGAARSAPRPSLSSNRSSVDRYGRMDLSGHAVPGYPSVRGDLGGPNSSYLSRGAASRRRPVPTRRPAGR